MVVSEFEIIILCVALPLTCIGCLIVGCIIGSLCGKGNTPSKKDNVKKTNDN